MYFKISIDDVYNKCHYLLENDRRLPNRDRVRELLHLCETAKTTYCVYTILDEHDFRLLFNKEIGKNV